MFVSRPYSRKFWPKPSTVYEWKPRTSGHVGFSGENLDPNSVAFLEQNINAARTYQTSIHEVDEQRKNDPNMPIKMSPRKLKMIRNDGVEDRCVASYIPISWKNPQLLSQFISPWSGRMYEKGVVNLTEKMYNKVRTEIKISIDNGLMGRNYKQTCFMSDPNLSSFEYNNKLSGTSDELPRSAYEKSSADRFIESLEQQKSEVVDARGGRSLKEDEKIVQRRSEDDEQVKFYKPTGNHKEKQQIGHEKAESEAAKKRRERKLAKAKAAGDKAMNT